MPNERKTEKPGRRAAEAPATVAVDFLKQLRPDGPWVLTAIKPEGGIQTITAKTEGEICSFINAKNGKANLYYSVNPTRTAMTSKAAKVDIAAVEYALADLDPRDAETPKLQKRVTWRHLKLSSPNRPQSSIAVTASRRCGGWPIRSIWPSPLR